ncbi:MAG TPA: glycosyl hydrolase family 28-related protein [Kofleriaceae bacterium]
MRTWLPLLLLAACSASTPGGGVSRGADTSGPPRARPGAVSVFEFGAIGDGQTDDRPAIQAAIAAAAAGRGEVFIPPGTYAISGTPHRHWGLDVPAGVHLRGAGADLTVLQQAPGAGKSERMIHVSGAHVSVEDLTLDGNKAKQQRPDEQRHGLFATDTQGLVISRIVARDFTGDGIYLFNGARGTRVDHVRATGSDRNGFTLGGDVDDTIVFASSFDGNAAQQFDSEPGDINAVRHTVITGCYLDGRASNDYTLTVSGNPKVRGSDWLVFGNRIDGSVFIVWAERVIIAGNTGVNATTKASVTVYRTSSDVEIIGNRFEQTQTRVGSLAGVLIQGTGTGSAPRHVRVLGNDLTLRDERSFGIRAEGAIDVELVDNTLHGAGRKAAGAAGIYVRATNTKEDFERAVVRGNTVRNFGARGVSVAGNGVAKLRELEISRNSFDDDSAGAAMTTGISLDDGAGAAQQIKVDGNRYNGAVRDAVANIPHAATVSIDGQPAGVP